MCYCYRQKATKSAQNTGKAGQISKNTGDTDLNFGIQIDILYRLKNYHTRIKCAE